MFKKLLILLIAILLMAGCGNEKVKDKQISIPFTNSKNETVEVRGSYTGEIDKNGKPSGKGIFKTISFNGGKWTYDGEFENGIIEGTGTIILDKGVKVEAKFHKGYANGAGKETQNGELVYKGEYKDSLRNGEGKLYNLDTGKIFYDGEFKDGVGEGKGKLYNIKGKVIYEGEVKDYTPNGQGISYKSDGTVDYKGGFVDGIESYGEYGLNKTVVSSSWIFVVKDVRMFKTIGDIQANGIFVIVAVDITGFGTPTTFEGKKYGHIVGDNYFVLIDDKKRKFKSEDFNARKARSQKLYPAYVSLLIDELGYRSNHVYIKSGKTVKNIAFLFDVPEDCKVLRLFPEGGSRGSKCVRIK